MNTALLLLLIVLVLAVVAFWVLRRAAPARPPATRPHRPADGVPAATSGRPAAPPTTATSAATSAAAAPAAPSLPERPLPAALAEFQLRSADALDAGERDALVQALRLIPRPPPSLHRLISPDFLASATSVEMSELVMGEPIIAAKVLSTVNSPLYGLQRPVTSIGQAITFLGMNTVRSICLRYMLDESFKAADPATQRVFEQLWTASAVASELCSRLSKQLHLAEAGTLVTQVVLGFIGHLALASLPASREKTDATDLAVDLVARYGAQQQTVGLSAPELGRLLMATWELPHSIVQGVADIDRVLIEPATHLDAVATRRAVAYLCARLGERLASGALNSPADWDPAADTAICTHHLPGYLSAPQIATVLATLKAPDTMSTLAPLLGR